MIVFREDDYDGELLGVGKFTTDKKLDDLYAEYADEHDIVWCMPPKRCRGSNNLMQEPEQIPSTKCFWKAIPARSGDIIEAWWSYTPLSRVIYSDDMYEWMLEKGYIEAVEYEEIYL